MNFIRGIQQGAAVIRDAAARPTVVAGFPPNDSLAATEYRDRVQRVSLTHLRIQQFLHLTDRHIPLPIIQLFLDELERPVSDRDKIALMVYTVLLRDWHLIRNQLNFIRDMTKLAVMLGRRLNENVVVIEAALNSVEVTQQEVYESIMTNMHDEARQAGCGFSEYMVRKYDENHGVGLMAGGDGGTALPLNSLHAVFPNSTIAPRTFWNSFTVRFLIRVTKETLRTVAKLDGSTSEFFTVSEPSWSHGNQNASITRTAREVAEEADIRRKLMERLLRGGGGEGGSDNDGGDTPTKRFRAVDQQRSRDQDEAAADTDDADDDGSSINTRMLREAYAASRLAKITEEESQRGPATDDGAAVVELAANRATTAAQPPAESPARRAASATFARLEANSRQLASTLSRLTAGNEGATANRPPTPTAADDFDMGNEEEEEEEEEEAQWSVRRATTDEMRIGEIGQAIVYTAGDYDDEVDKEDEKERARRVVEEEAEGEDEDEDDDDEMEFDDEE